MTILLSIFVILLLLAAFVYFDLKLEMHFSNQFKEGEMYFAVTGEGQIDKVIMAFEESSASQLIECARAHGVNWTCKDSSWLSKYFGIYFISWRWPAVKIHEFRIVAEGLKDGTPGKEKPQGDAPMREWLYQEKRLVRGLRRKFPRPVLVEGVELRDRITVDNIIMEQLEVVDFYKPIFEYHGDFFRMVNTVSESALNDMVVRDPDAPPDEKAYSYTEYVNLNKGEGSEFAKSLRTKINTGSETGLEEDAEPGEGLTDAIGIVCNRAFVHKFSLSPDQKEVEEAVRLKEVKRLRAEALQEEASGEARAEERRATGKANAMRTVADAEIERVEKLAKPFSAIGADPNVVTTSVGSLLKTEKLPKDLTTYVEGGASAMVAVPTSPKKDGGT